MPSSVPNRSPPKPPGMRIDPRTSMIQGQNTPPKNLPIGTPYVPSKFRSSTNYDQPDKKYNYDGPTMPTMLKRPRDPYRFPPLPPSLEPDINKRFQPRQAHKKGWQDKVFAKHDNTYPPFGPSTVQIIPTSFLDKLNDPFPTVAIMLLIGVGAWWFLGRRPSYA